MRLILLSVLVLAGCTHGELGVVGQPLAKGTIPAGAPIYIAPVNADEVQVLGDKSSDLARVAQEKGEIKSRYNRLIASDLRKKGFKAMSFASGHPTRGYVLVGHVARLDHGSAADRLMVHDGSGASTMSTEFTLINVATHEAMAKFEVVASSDGSAGFQAPDGNVTTHLNDGAAQAADYLAKANGTSK